MTTLTMVFLKIFFRNKRAIFFVIFLPACLFLILSFLRFEQVIQFNLGQKYSDFLLPGIVAFSAMQMGIYTAAYSLIDYRKQKVLKRLAVTPLTARHFLLSAGSARFIVALIQTVLLLVLSFALFGTIPDVRIVIAPFILLIGVIIFLNFGSIIASLARDYEEAAPYTTIVGLISSFFGDAFFPVTSLPQPLQYLAAALPMKPFVALLRYSFFGLDQDHFVTNLFVLLAWLAASTIAAKIIFSRKAYY